jgi:hypothetical protein
MSPPAHTPILLKLARSHGRTATPLRGTTGLRRRFHLPERIGRSAGGGGIGRSLLPPHIDGAVWRTDGTAGEDDEITEPAHASLCEEDPDGDDSAGGGVFRYSGSVKLARPGPFGYTVRVLPRHEPLASHAELGLVVLPAAPAGMTNGDLR